MIFLVSVKLVSVLVDSVVVVLIGISVLLRFVVVNVFSVLMLNIGLLE